MPSSNMLRIELVQPPKYFVEYVKLLLASIVSKSEDRQKVYGILGGVSDGSEQTSIPEGLEELCIEDMKGGGMGGKTPRVERSED